MFEKMSHEPTVRDYGLCPECSVDVVRVVCEKDHGDCFSVECSRCDFWESNCYGGNDDDVDVSLVVDVRMVDAIGEFIQNEFDCGVPTGLAVDYLNEWLQDHYGKYANDWVRGFVADYWESIDEHFPSINSGSPLGLLLGGLR
jgi:hypothetical protein